jgi:hypothetical protein
MDMSSSKKPPDGSGRSPGEEVSIFLAGGENEGPRPAGGNMSDDMGEEDLPVPRQEDAVLEADDGSVTSEQRIAAMAAFFDDNNELFDILDLTESNYIAEVLPRLRQHFESVGLTVSDASIEAMLREGLSSGILPNPDTSFETRVHTERSGKNRPLFGPYEKSKEKKRTKKAKEQGDEEVRPAAMVRGAVSHNVGCVG